MFKLRSGVADLEPIGSRCDSTKESNAMNKVTTSTAVPTRALKLEALSNVVASFESFCLASGLEALREMMDHDAQAICGPRHARSRERHLCARCA